LPQVRSSDFCWDDTALKSNSTQNLTLKRTSSPDVSFSVPSLKVPTSAMVPAADRNTSIGTVKLRVVAVDDNAEFLREFTGLLRTEFEVVATAVEGESALECIRRYRPDVVVLDLEMPRLNGIQVTQQLAADPLSPAVVICSVEDDPEIVDAALKAGALRYVVKSRIREDLIAAVKSADAQSFISRGKTSIAMAGEHAQT
jgi:CheY-like chemotaxis protein